MRATHSCSSRGSGARRDRAEIAPHIWRVHAARASLRRAPARAPARHHWSRLHVRRGVTNTFNPGIIDKKERHKIDEALLGREGEKTRI